MVVERLQAATSNLTSPFAVVDLDALDANAAFMITEPTGFPFD
jgi:D-serine deaminase-like pyridoxal phosphate-dependent protein